MRGAFSAGSWLLLLVLGCGGVTTSNPDSSSTPGGTSAGGNPAAPSECGCLVEEIAWWRDGGLVPSRIKSRLTGCAEFEYEETSDEPGQSKLCSATLEACVDAFDSDDVNGAIAHPDVQAALARAPLLFGADPRDVDGRVDHIEVGGKVIEVGNPCPSPDQAPDCVIPKGVENLDRLLGYLQLQQLVIASCKVQ